MSRPANKNIKKNLLLLGLSLIIGFFIWTVYLFNHAYVVDRTTYFGKLSILAGILIACFLLLSGICTVLNVDLKKMSIGFSLFMIWSFGLIVIPIPEGYGEAVLGGYAIFWMLLLAAFFKYKEYRKKKNSLELRKS